MLIVQLFLFAKFNLETLFFSTGFFLNQTEQNKSLTIELFLCPVSNARTIVELISLEKKFLSCCCVVVCLFADFILKYFFFNQIFLLANASKLQNYFLCGFICKGNRRSSLFRKSSSHSCPYLFFLRILKHTFFSVLFRSSKPNKNQPSGCFVTVGYIAKTSIGFDINCHIKSLSQICFFFALLRISF